MSNSDLNQASTLRELLSERRAQILELLAQRGVNAVQVFGSVARGEDGVRSDVDLLVSLSTESSLGGELLTVLGLSEELSDLLGLRVHVVTPRTLRRDALELALTEAVPL